MSDESEMKTDGPAIKFKSIKKKRPLRKRRASESDEERSDDVRNQTSVDDQDEEFNRDKLKATLELQKLRQRASGVSHVTLASGKKVSKIEVLAASSDPTDPFKLKAGGLLSLKAARQARDAQDGIVRCEGFGGANDMGENVVGTQFSKETQVRDEDEEMRKFIEAEMERRRGLRKDSDTNSKNKYMTPEERALSSLPEHLRKSTFRKNEEMLSSQMLSGIPEVDLGIEEKIRNIEATEEAKKRFQAAQEAERRKRANPSEFVPTNLAVNFQQPNRFKTDVPEEVVAASLSVKGTPVPKVPKKSEATEIVTQRTVQVGDVPLERVIVVNESTEKPVDPHMATDDLHLTKFKQHFHRK